MPSRHQESWKPALLGVGIVAVQALELWLLRDSWWGWTRLASGALLHTSLWVVIAAALGGVWLVLPMREDGSFSRLRSSVRHPAEIAWHTLWPFTVVVVIGQLMLASILALLGKTGYGSLDWLLVLAGPPWAMAGLVWGCSVASVAPWKTAWLLGPGVPLLILMLGTSRPWLREFLPFMPNANPMIEVSLAQRGYILVVALSVLVLTTSLIIVPRVRAAAVGLVIGLAAVPSAIGFGTPQTDAEAMTESCREVNGFEACWPAAHRAMRDQLLESLGAIEQKHAQLLRVQTVSTVPGTDDEKVLVIVPYRGWRESMLVSDTDIRLALADSLANSGCPDNWVNPLFALRAAEILEVADTPEGEALRSSAEALVMADPDLQDAREHLEELDAGSLGVYLEQRRRDVDVCHAPIAEFLGER